MKIGKYEVVTGAEVCEGGYRGHAMLTWQEGAQTVERPIYFDSVLPTADAAHQHASEQIRARVHNGDL